jgi:pimeloyl-ACP methyl ester carboxylesterase
MPKAFFNGVGIHYESVGSGPDIIMIHGLAANLAFWFLRLVPALSTRFRVTVYDLRGHGYSDMPLRGYTSADMACDLRGLMDHAGIERADLVGHSFGGAIALHFALLFPGRVRTVTLADARVHALQPLPKRGDGDYWGVWRQNIQRLGIDIPEDMPRIAYSFFEELAREQNSGRELSALPFFGSLGMWAVEKRVAKRWQKLLRSSSALTDLSDPSGLTEDLIRGIDLPMLAMYGEYSHCMPTCTRIAQLLPQCERIILRQVGHFHPVVRPVEFIEQLTKFLRCQHAS